MVSVKEYMIRSDERLAEHLGITPEELEQLDYEIDAESSDDDLVYCYRVEFSEECPLYILEKIVGLEDDRFVRLSPSLFDDNTYDYDAQYDAVSDNKSPLDNFSEEMADIKQLIVLPVESNIQAILFRQVFVNIIGLMETFLSDTFINLTLQEDIYFRNFIKTHPAFRERKFELRDIFEQSASLRETAKVVMLDMIYHKLPEVREMYRATFEIKFPSIRTMQAYVRDRHDLVHRNGKRKDGSALVIENTVLLTLVEDTTAFVEEIAQAIKQAQHNLPF